MTNDASIKRLQNLKKKKKKKKIFLHMQLSNDARGTKKGSGKVFIYNTFIFLFFCIFI